ncbi:hypothetical protein [Methanopyrus kandleri]|uniref:Uncharacterized secreted protein specific for M.kandleri, MK-3 family n=1 Tax=Methanopyrus kandleri (strain AV19 / DSM 6324 / JCM 9639 / NBRC 100938) TaxID=190192 RepID=Q8TVU3_METKA|nr:hypothetical protein [Methanopyrus kandleri]AAM02508.1 Uncharacterized secreted protein specific for M.kandleri, MK-3 family [Methanopyrus kandleri AV19]
MTVVPLVLGLILTATPSAGEPLIRGKASDDIGYLARYFESVVEPKWKSADARIVVDARGFRGRTVDVVYVPGLDAFVVPAGGRPRGSVTSVSDVLPLSYVECEPGKVRIRLDRVGRTVVVEGPAVVVRGLYPPIPLDVSALVDGYRCTVVGGVQLPIDGGCPLAPRPYVPPAAVLEGGGSSDRVVLADGPWPLLDVEYLVGGDVVNMRVQLLEDPLTSALELAIATVSHRKADVAPLQGVEVTFDLGSGKIRTRHVAVPWRPTGDTSEDGVGTLKGGVVMRTADGLEPLLVWFEVARDDPMMEFISDVVEAYRRGDFGEVGRLMKAHPNVVFLFPEGREGFWVYAPQVVPLRRAHRRRIAGTRRRGSP